MSQNAYQKKNAGVYKTDSDKFHQYLFQLFKTTCKVLLEYIMIVT